MTINMFLFMLLLFAGVSSLITEGIKMFMKDKKNLASNIIVLIVSLIVGSVGMIIYYILNDVVIRDKEIIFIILMSLATWLSSMHGFDKIKQTVLQWRKSKNTVDIIE